MKTIGRIGGYIIIALLLVLSFSLSPASASISPDSLQATLTPGESITEMKEVHIETVPPKADVIFAFDVTASMTPIIATAKINAITIMNTLNLIPGVDIHYGVMSYMDYIGEFSSCGYSNSYGSVPDYPYSLDQSITGSTTPVVNAINGLIIGHGDDLPQDYTRVFYESYADTSVGWRPGAKRILVNFGDNVPHDCNLNEGVTGGTWSTGVDPGRNGVVGGGDDLDLQTVLAAMATNGVTLLECHTTSTNSVYWTYWTGLTGGDFYITGSTTLVTDVVNAVETELTAAEVHDVHLEVTPGFESWLESVSPPSYPVVVPCNSVLFEITIRVPDGTLSGIYNFTISAVDGVGVNYGDQAVQIEVIGPPPPPPPTYVVGGTVVQEDMLLVLLPWAVVAGLLVLATGAGLFARRRLKR